MLKLKLQYFGHLMQKTDSLEKTFMLGKIEDGSRRGNRGWDGWMALPTRWTWVWVSSGSWWSTRKPGMLQSTGSQRVWHDWVTELNWTDCISWNTFSHYLLTYLSIILFPLKKQKRFHLSLKILDQWSTETLHTFRILGWGCGSLFSGESGLGETSYAIFSLSRNIQNT